MKDIEKIKSEDLGCQVQDANPGNFAIEQEVAQLVGATVPQPTEPSADDARELGAQLLVFLRRALLPIRSALRTALAAIYAHLDSRCTAYTPAGYAPYLPLPSYDPMGTPPTPRTLPNLLTALTAFASRKISNGSATNDGIKDGESLMHILSGDYSAITKLGDDNSDYTMTLQPATLLGYFPNCKKFVYGCSRALVDFDYNTTNIEEMEFPNLTYYKHPNTTARHNFCMVRGKMERVNFPELTYYGARDNGYGNGLVCDLPNCKEFKAQKLATWWAQDSRYPAIYNCPNLEVVDFRSLPAPVLHCTQSGITAFDNCPNLIDINFKEYTASRDMSGWNPTNVLADADKTATFLSNFKEHIALRLTSNGSGKTLTLSQAVFSAVIEGTSPICDDIKGIIEDKGWKVQDTNNNIFPTT